MSGLRNSDFGLFSSGGGTSSGVTSVGATTPIASSGGTTPNISISQSSGSTNGFLSSTDWTTFNNKPINNQIVAGYQGLGSTIKAVPIGASIYPGFNAVVMTDGLLFLNPIYLSAPSTITGVKWFQSVLGNYVGDNYNGVGLYSVTGGGTTITLIASSTNDANIWRTFSSNTWGNKAFSSPIPNLAVGTYFIGGLYNALGVATTTPSIGSFANVANAQQGFDFTSRRFAPQLTSQTTLPSPLTLSTTTNTNNPIWLSLY